MTIDTRCNSIKKVTDLSLPPPSLTNFYRAQILIDYNNWVNNIQQLGLINSQSDRAINNHLLKCYHNLLKREGYNSFEVLCQNFIGIPDKLPIAIRNNLSSLLQDSYPLIQVRIAEGVKSKKERQGSNVDPMINGEITRLLRRHKNHPIEKVFLFSGDSDFIDIAAAIAGEGISFTFIGSPPCLSNKIIQEVHHTNLNLITLEELLLS